MGFRILNSYDMRISIMNICLCVVENINYIFICPIMAFQQS